MKTHNCFLHPFFLKDDITRYTYIVSELVTPDRHSSWEVDPDSNDDKHLKITGNKKGKENKRSKYVTDLSLRDELLQGWLNTPYSHHNMNGWLDGNIQGSNLLNTKNKKEGKLLLVKMWILHKLLYFIRDTSVMLLLLLLLLTPTWREKNFGELFPFPLDLKVIFLLKETKACLICYFGIYL